MRRKANVLIPLEYSILRTAMELKLRGTSTFHGFSIAREIKEREGKRQLTAHGTLYKALDRLLKSGFLESEWEDPLLAANQGRPRRRFYWITTAGEAALARAEAEAVQLVPASRPGLATP